MSKQTSKLRLTDRHRVFSGVVTAVKTGSLSGLSEPIHTSNHPESMTREQIGPLLEEQTKFLRQEATAAMTAATSKLNLMIRGTLREREIICSGMADCFDAVKSHFEGTGDGDTVDKARGARERLHQYRFLGGKPVDWPGLDELAFMALVAADSPHLRTVHVERGSLVAREFWGACEFRPNQLSIDN